MNEILRRGLNHQLDLPSFLRGEGPNAGQRAQTIRDWLLQLPDRVNNWIELLHGREGLRVEHSLRLRRQGNAHGNHVGLGQHAQEVRGLAHLLNIVRRRSIAAACGDDARHRTG